MIAPRAPAGGYNIVSQADFEDAARKIEQAVTELIPKAERETESKTGVETDFGHSTDIKQHTEEKKAALRLIV